MSEYELIVSELGWLGLSENFLHSPFQVFEVHDT